jgi:hypothetical protein
MDVCSCFSLLLCVPCWCLIKWASSYINCLRINSDSQGAQLNKWQMIHLCYMCGWPVVYYCLHRHLNIAYSEAMERSLIDCGDDRVQGFLLLPVALSASVLWHISASLKWLLPMNIICYVLDTVSIELAKSQDMWEASWRENCKRLREIWKDSFHCSSFCVFSTQILLLHML